MLVVRLPQENIVPFVSYNLNNKPNIATEIDYSDGG